MQQHFKKLNETVNGEKDVKEAKGDALKENDLINKYIKNETELLEKLIGGMEKDRTAAFTDYLIAIKKVLNEIKDELNK